MPDPGIHLSRGQFWTMFVGTPAATLGVMVGIVFLARPDVGVLARAYAAAAPGDDDAQVEREGRLLAEVRHLVRNRYVDEVPPDQLLYGAAGGMVASLDGVSQFLPPDVYREERIDVLGHFGGLGIQIDVVDGWLTVVTPIEDSPAYHAGVRAGDRLVAVEGASTEGWSEADAADRLRGKPGTTVKVTVVHWADGEREPVDLTIERAEVRLKSIRDARIVDGAPGIGYVRCTTFAESTAEELDTALEGLRAEGCRALVLDLRWNPGGLLLQGVAVADRFLEAGTIVEVRGRDRATERHAAKAGETFPGAPVALLVNDRSASAAEIVAGALQDHGRARLVGARTYGKGTVQTVCEVDEGRSAVRLTTARYYTPKGRSIQPAAGPRGLEPDEAIDLTRDQRRTVQLAWRAAGIVRDGPPAPLPHDPQRERAVAWLSAQLAR